MKFKLALLCGLALAGANASACYTIYDANDRVVYRGVEAPVDMSLPVHQTVGRRFPGAHMVFDVSNACDSVAITQVSRPSSADLPPNSIRMERTTRTLPGGAAAPLLTDRRTAMAMNLPHRVMEGEIVMVPAEVAARVDLPSMTVIPATQFARAPDTSTLAAGPAPATATMGAGPAPGGTVITEMHNPPLTAVQRDGRTAIIQRY